MGENGYLCPHGGKDADFGYAVVVAEELDRDECRPCRNQFT